MNIYFYSPSINTPSGGIKKIYDNVDILNSHGYCAFVLHPVKGFRCDWFKNNTAIAYGDEVKFYPDDILVLPEIYGSQMDEKVPGIKKVIFNQSGYLTFWGYSLDKNDLKTPYTNNEVIATITVSEDTRNYLNYIFPEMKIYRVYNSIDNSLFYYQENKKNQICYMPRKQSDDSMQVINILKFRGVLKNWEIVPIENKTLPEVAQIMRESKIFLSFCYQEGFSLPPAEAIACGCAVIGFHGMGGREYFTKENAFPVETGDVISFAKATEEVINLWKNQPEIIIDKTRKASEYILKSYSKEMEEKSIVETWQELINIKVPEIYAFSQEDNIIEDYTDFSGISVDEIVLLINNLNDLEEKEKDFYYLLKESRSTKHVIHKLIAINPQIISEIDSHPGKKLLDFGGGIGTFSQFISQFNKDVTYFQKSGKAFDFASWRFYEYGNKINLVSSDSDIFDQQDKFDIVYSQDYLSKSAKPEDLILKLCNKVNPDGLLILIDNNLDLSQNEIQDILKNHGFITISGENKNYSIWKKVNCLPK